MYLTVMLVNTVYYSSKAYMMSYTTVMCHVTIYNQSARHITSGTIYPIHTIVLPCLHLLGPAEFKIDIIYEYTFLGD